MRLQLSKLQVENPKETQVRVGLGCEQGPKDGGNDINEVLHHQSFLFDPEIICTKLISQYHNNPPASHFGVKKTEMLVSRKYYWPTFQADIKPYVKGCIMCLASKAVCHKSYGDLQLLSVLTH